MVLLYIDAFFSLFFLLRDAQMEDDFRSGLWISTSGPGSLNSSTPHFETLRYVYVSLSLCVIVPASSLGENSSHTREKWGRVVRELDPEVVTVLRRHYAVTDFALILI